MGKLIKNHWARLIVLTAAAYQIAASLEAFFWPKIFFDFLTKLLDPAVKPLPILQTLNLLFALITLAYEWPLKYLAGRPLHRSIEARMLWLPLCCLSSMLMYQGTNPALYYLIGCGVYFWAYTEGEMVCAVPWTLPKRIDRKPRAEKA
ncbi:hypothetical protein LTR08_000543 [Meristemomyces frigidus]|nr:hypothetical protein LTR08_000543 [Meristemomyces frigidus]